MSEAANWCGLSVVWHPVLSAARDLFTRAVLYAVDLAGLAGGLDAEIGTTQYHVERICHTMQGQGGSLQKLFIAHDVIEAIFVRDLLRRGGIAAEVHGETLPHIHALLPSVWIMEDSQLEDARALIEDYERRKNINLADSA